MTKVVIGCKLPNGIYMQVGEKTQVINGFNASIVEGGHGITYDVPKDLWEAWLAENKNRDLVKNGFIFAHGKDKDTKEEAKEKKENKSKTEPLEQKSGEGVAPADK